MVAQNILIKTDNRWKFIQWTYLYHYLQDSSALLPQRAALSRQFARSMKADAQDIKRYTLPVAFCHILEQLFIYFQIKDLAKCSLTHITTLDSTFSPAYTAHVTWMSLRERERERRWSTALMVSKLRHHKEYDSFMKIQRDSTLCE